MTKMPLAAAAVLLLVCSATALFAQGVPKSVDAVPLYKGFALDETSRSGNADGGGSYRTYTCRTVDMTDVLDWYCSEMGMPLGSGMGPGADRDTVVRNGAAGTVSRVRLSVRGPGLEGAEKSKDWEGAQKNLEWLKAQWKEKRRTVNGDYIANALFEWTAVKPNGQYEDIEVYLSDESFNWHDMIASQMVELRIGTRAAAGNAGMPARTSAGAPTEKDLGLPLYPGALYSAQNSRVIQTMMSCAWTSNDSAQKVIAFYEKATGLKSISGSGKYMIQILPSAGNPSLTLIMVGPNTSAAMGAGKTLLVINKQKM